MSPKYVAALDHAAEIIAAAIGVPKVGRDPVGADELSEDEIDETGVVVALSDGLGAETGYLMGAAEPYEFERSAALEIFVAGGDAAARRRKRDELVMKASAVVAADPTLGGRVDFAELTEAEPTADERYVAIAANLNLTYSAPTALG